MDADYEDIQLRTEYFRLPAIKTYLRLGYLPVLYCEEVEEMWREVCEQLPWEFSPDRWPAA